MNAHVLPGAETVSNKKSLSTIAKLDIEIGRAYDLSAMLGVCEGAIGIDGVSHLNEKAANQLVGDVGRQLAVLRNLAGSMVGALELIHRELKTDATIEYGLSSDGDRSA